MASGSTKLKWEPSSLVFPVAISKVSVQQLRALNTSTDVSFSFKVKTTNPKRYSVRPNVGVVFPGEGAMVTVQLPAMKELPPDMSKCKDKFQVLSLPLGPDQAREMHAMSAEARRAALTALWAADAAKEAIVDKIRCAFTFDSTCAAPIPEEEGPITPYSPETVPGNADAATPARSPFVTRGESAGEELGGANDTEPATPRSEPATPKATARQLDAQLSASIDEVIDAAAAESALAAARAAEKSLGAELGALRAKLAAEAKLGKELQKKLDAAGKRAPPPPPAAPSGFGLLSLLLVAAAAFVGGLAASQQGLVPPLPGLPLARPPAGAHARRYVPPHGAAEPHAADGAHGGEL